MPVKSKRKAKRSRREPVVKERVEEPLETEVPQPDLPLAEIHEFVAIPSENNITDVKVTPEKDDKRKLNILSKLSATKFTTFSDICSPKSTARVEAAKSFKCLLELFTDRKIDMDQTEPGNPDAIFIKLL